MTILRSLHPVVVATVVVLAVPAAWAQMNQMSPAAEGGAPAMQGDDGAAPAMQQPASPATKAAAQKLAERAKAAPSRVNDAPLNATERAQQMLNRFTFGARPGEVEKVTAMGAQNWFEKQLKPDQIPDGAVQKRIATDYPALALKPVDLLMQFPNRHIIDLVAQGKQAYPTEPIAAGLYETQVYKWNAERDQKNAAGQAVPPPVLTDEQVAQKKKEDQATAA
ncbi:MAG TPA: DUF1800 family protein, partial [Acidobacteriaceae bacterium]